VGILITLLNFETTGLRPHMPASSALENLPSAQPKPGPAIAPTPAIEAEYATASCTAIAASEETPEIVTAFWSAPRLSASRYRRHRRPEHQDRGDKRGMRLQSGLPCEVDRTNDAAFP
jgi:hypothetical protein